MRARLFFPSILCLSNTQIIGVDKLITDIFRFSYKGPMEMTLKLKIYTFKNTSYRERTYELKNKFPCKMQLILELTL